jgi:uncharacterized RDD family membrane protein YckC
VPGSDDVPADPGTGPGGRDERNRPPRPELRVLGPTDRDPGPSVPVLPDPHGVPLPQRLRLAARRAVQFALDLAITALLCLVPLSVGLVLPRNPDGTLGMLLLSIPVLLLAMLACLVIGWWYWAGLPARRGGRTPAMRWLGLRVRRLDGGEAGAAAMGVRWLFLLVDGMFLGAVGGVSILLTDRGQRVGDVLAGTVVVHEPGPH